MLTIAWAELETISKEITRLQDERNVAKQNDDVGRAAQLAMELDRAIVIRDSLVARIGSLVGEGAKSTKPPRPMAA